MFKLHFCAPKEAPKSATNNNNVLSQCIVWLHAFLVISGSARLWAGNQPHQPPHTDPAGQEREGASLQSNGGERTASQARVCNAGNTQMF